jgi:hypothetical protein
MTHERDIDHVLDRWMDDGPTVVADRVIAAAMTDVHTTRQRGARWASLKELFMTMKPAMTVLGVAAVAIVALAAYQIAAGDGGIGATRQIGADDLPAIVANDTNTPGTWEQDVDLSGEAAMTYPMRSTVLVDVPGFVDGRGTQMCGESDAGVPQGCLVAWVALFDTTANAEAAYDFYTAEFESPEGWDFPPESRSQLGDLGDEAVIYTDVVDPHGGPLINELYLWRSDRLVLAALGVAEMEGESLRDIAAAMDTRAAR